VKLRSICVFIKLVSPQCAEWKCWYLYSESLSTTWRQKSFSRSGENVGLSGCSAEGFPYVPHDLQHCMIYGNLASFSPTYYILERQITVYICSAGNKLFFLPLNSEHLQVKALKKKHPDIRKSCIFDFLFILRTECLDGEEECRS
jgi:hypothetical protein